MRRLSTKEASRSLLLLPLLFAGATSASAQFVSSTGRPLPAYLVSSTPAPFTQATPTRFQALIFTEAVPRLVVKQSFQFAVAAVNADGSKVKLTDVTWRSSNPDVAGVSSTGMVIAYREGRTFITAVSGRREVRVRLSVLQPAPVVNNPVTSVELTPNTASIESGTSLQFAHSARTADGAVVPDAQVSYASNDTSIALVSASGLLSARSVGTVQVTATSGSATGKVSVAVGRAKTTAIAVTPTPIAITTADTVALAVAGTRRDGSKVALADMTPTAQKGSFRSWTYVPPKTAGVDTITVTSSDGFAVRVAATVKAVAAPAPAPADTVKAPAPAPAPIGNGSMPSFTAPARPAATVNVAVPAVTGRTIRVAAGDVAGLQAALRSAVGGDEIVLPNGSDFVGNFELPKHAGAGVVTVRSETIGVPAGTRMTPGVAAGLAKIGTNYVAGAFYTAPGASGWRLMGLNISMRAGAVDNYGLVQLGSGIESSASEFVSNIVLDRVFITGSDYQTSRCVGFNGNALAVVDSWLAECHAKGRDAQGVGGWTGNGPFLIQNNHIEGSGQAVMFGGADPRVSGVIPSDITIRGNHFYKPMTWANGKWSVKATFELKSAKRVLFEGNVLENHWADAQTGFAILMQTINQEGTAPWSTIQDVTVQNNIIRKSTSGINLLSRVTADGHVVNEQTQRVLVRNNVFVDVGRDPVNGSAGRLMQVVSDLKDVTIIQNTFAGAMMASSAAMFDGLPQIRTMIVNNVFSPTEYGLFGSGYGEGNGALSYFLRGSIVAGNAIVGRPAQAYPTGNSFPTSVSATDFVSAASGDYTLRSTVTWSNYFGSLVGANGQSVIDATRNAVTP